MVGDGTRGPLQEAPLPFWGSTEAHNVSLASRAGRAGALGLEESVSLAACADVPDGLQMFPFPPSRRTKATPGCQCTGPAWLELPGNRHQPIWAKLRAGLGGRQRCEGRSDSGCAEPSPAAPWPAGTRRPEVPIREQSAPRPPLCLL